MPKTLSLSENEKKYHEVAQRLRRELLGPEYRDSFLLGNQNYNKLSNAERHQICKDISDKIDDNASGVVTLGELKTYILSIPDNKDLNDNLDLLLIQLDPDRTGKVSLKEIERFIWPPQYENIDVSTMNGQLREIATVVELISKSIIKLFNTSLTNLSDEDLLKELASKFKIQLLHGKLIDVHNMKKVIMNLDIPEFKYNLSLSSKEYDEVMHTLDCNGDGVISGKELRGWLTSIKQIHKNDAMISYLQSIIQNKFNGSISEMFSSFSSDSDESESRIYKENFINSMTILDRDISKHDLVDLANLLLSSDKVSITLNTITDFLGTSENLLSNIAKDKSEESNQKSNEVKINNDNNNENTVGISQSKKLVPIDSTSPPKSESKLFGKNQLLTPDQKGDSPTDKKKNKNIQSLEPLTKSNETNDVINKRSPNNKSPLEKFAKKVKDTNESLPISDYPSPERSDSIDAIVSTKEFGTEISNELENNESAFLQPRQPLVVDTNIAPIKPIDSITYTNISNEQQLQQPLKKKPDHEEEDDPIHAELLRQIQQNSQDYNLPPPKLNNNNKNDETISSSLTITKKSIFEKSMPFDEQEPNSFIGNSKVVGMNPQELLKLGFNKHLGRFRGHPYDTWTCCNTSELSCPDSKLPTDKTIDIVARNVDPLSSISSFDKKKVKRNPDYVELKLDKYSNLNQSFSSQTLSELEETIITQPPPPDMNILVPSQFRESRYSKETKNENNFKLENSAVLKDNVVTTRTDYNFNYTNRQDQFLQTELEIYQSEKSVQCNTLSEGDKVESLEKEIEKLKSIQLRPESSEISIQTDNSLYDNIILQNSRTMVEKFENFIQEKNRKRELNKRPPFVVKTVCDCGSYCNCKPLIIPTKDEIIVKSFSSATCQTDLVVSNKCTQSDPVDSVVTMVDRSSQYYASVISESVQTNVITFDASLQTHFIVNNQGSQYEPFLCNQITQTEKKEPIKKDIFIEDKRPPFVVKHLCNCGSNGFEDCFSCGSHSKSGNNKKEKENIITTSFVGTKLKEKIKEPIQLIYDNPQQNPNMVTSSIQTDDPINDHSHEHFNIPPQRQRTTTNSSHQIYDINTEFDQDFDQNRLNTNQKKVINKKLKRYLESKDIHPKVLDSTHQLLSKERVKKVTTKKKKISTVKRSSSADGRNELSFSINVNSLSPQRMSKGTDTSDDIYENNSSRSHQHSYMNDVERSYNFISADKQTSLFISDDVAIQINTNNNNLRISNEDPIEQDAPTEDERPPFVVKHICYCGGNGYDNCFSCGSRQKPRNEKTENVIKISLQNKNMSTASIQTDSDNLEANKNFVISPQTSKKSYSNSADIIIETISKKAVKKSQKTIIKQNANKDMQQILVHVNSAQTSNTAIIVTSPTIKSRKDTQHKKETLKIKLPINRNKDIILDFDKSPCPESFRTTRNSHASQSSYKSFIHEVQTEIKYKNNYLAGKRTLGTFNQSIYPFNEES